MSRSERGGLGEMKLVAEGRESLVEAGNRLGGLIIAAALPMAKERVERSSLGTAFGRAVAGVDPLRPVALCSLVASMGDGHSSRRSSG